MMLFDDMERSDLGPARKAESGYDYLNRSARNSAAMIRQQIEDWYSAYPLGGKADVKSRWRSKERHNQASAYLEIVIHALLCRLGYQVDVHPQLVDSPNQPDFIAIGKETLFVEAVVADGESQKAQGAATLKDVVHDELNKITSERFFLHLVHLGQPETAPPTKRWRQEIEQWLRAIDPDELLERDGEPPSMVLRHGSYAVEMTVISKGQPRAGRLIGSSFHGVHRDSSAAAVRRVLKAKASRYGALGNPFIIVVNALGDLADDDDFADALFGSLAYEVEPGEWLGREVRLKDGFFREPSSRKVSAVIAFRDLGPWTLGHAKCRVYSHPWTEKPYDGVLNTLDRVVVRDGLAHLKPGYSIAKLLGCDDSWLNNYSAS